MSTGQGGTEAQTRTWGWDVEDVIGGPHSPLSDKERTCGVNRVVVRHWVVAGYVHVCSYVLERAAGWELQASGGPGKLRLSSGVLHTQAREHATRQMGIRPEAVGVLFQKVPQARQHLLTGFQPARSRGVLCGTEHVTHKFLSVGQSAVLTFPLCPRTQQMAPRSPTSRIC